MDIQMITTQRVLSPTQISLADYVINPYRGCAFGCLYCYVQKNKNIKSKNKPWGSFLKIKINAAQVLEKELKIIRPGRVLLGSVTECFQPAEKKYKITRQILTILNRENIPYTILTKSNIIEDYLDVISYNKQNKIYFTLNIAEQKYIDLLEKNSPPLVERLKTIKKIITRDIDLRIHIGPFIPGVSSLSETLKILPTGTREVDVELYHHGMGEFEKICGTLSKEEVCKLTETYANAKNYYAFTKSLRDEIETLKNKRNLAFFFIVPDYNRFYTSGIDYSQRL